MGKLFVVPTPIGNLEDITLRALSILKQCPIILAEDTRTSSVLLKHYEIKNKLFSHHKFNEHQSSEEIVRMLTSSEDDIALISDAGTPCISDPGYFLVRACIAADIDVECLPGPTAFVPALVLSGLPCDRFVFEGFLPHKKGRKTRIEQLRSEQRTIIFYESPFRIVKTLQQLLDIFEEDRRASVTRELSKKFEETVRGTFTELIDHFTQNTPKGEFVLIIEGAKL